MIHRLSVILKKCNNSKFRKSYIKYLKTLDYDEFKVIFSHYMRIIAKINIRYSTKKIKPFSKLWFNKQFIKIEYRKILNIFYFSNFDFVLKIGTEIFDLNSKKLKLLKDIEETKITLNNINEIKSIKLESKEDYIKYSALMIQKFYFSEQLEKLVNELNDIKNDLV